MAVPPYRIRDLQRLGDEVSLELHVGQFCDKVGSAQIWWTKGSSTACDAGYRVLMLGDFTIAPVTSNGTETDARTGYSSYLRSGSNWETNNNLSWDSYSTRLMTNFRDNIKKGQFELFLPFIRNPES